MTLKELTSNESLQSFLDTNPLCVVCFSAHWCGPCKASKPQLEALAKSSTKVPIAIIHESDLGDYLTTFNIRAFPTYVLFHNSKELQRIEGVNLKGVQEMIDAHSDKAGPSIPTTGGYTMGGGENASAADARALRLARFGGGGAASESTTSPAKAAPPSQEEPAKATIPMDTNEDSKPAATSDASQESKDNGDNDQVMEDATTDAEPAMKNPADDLDPAAIKTLTEEMGFALIRAQKGLLNSSAKTVESAIEWLMQHQDDDDIDEPIPLVPASAGGTAKSFKCVKTGKIFKDMVALELYANRTGYTDFEESTEEVKPLTPEEKAAKILEIKELLKKKRQEREEAEKVDHTEREKQRRFMGKEMSQTREEMEKEQRKRDAQARKREKLEMKKERERIRAELEKDKRERMANKGKLKGRLGVDGYAPSAIQYDQDGGEEPAAQKPKTSGANAAKIDEYIAKVASYRAGGDGGKCLKVLSLLVGNAADNPTEEKYKSVNTETKTYKNKIKPFLGAKQLLLAVGFGIPEGDISGSRLVLKADADIEVLKATKTKLQQALEKY